LFANRRAKISNHILPHREHNPEPERHYIQVEAEPGLQVKLELDFMEQSQGKQHDQRVKDDIERHVNDDPPLHFHIY
jgi:hypothetical protein